MSGGQGTWLPRAPATIRCSAAVRRRPLTLHSPVYSQAIFLSSIFLSVLTTTRSSTYIVRLRKIFGQRNLDYCRFLTKYFRGIRTYVNCGQLLAKLFNCTFSRDRLTETIYFSFNFRSFPESL